MSLFEPLWLVSVTLCLPLSPTYHLRLFALLFLFFCNNPSSFSLAFSPCACSLQLPLLFLPFLTVVVRMYYHLKKANRTNLIKNVHGVACSNWCLSLC